MRLEHDSHPGKSGTEAGDWGQMDRIMSIVKGGEEHPTDSY
jgi:hypothetical protein